MLPIRKEGRYYLAEASVIVLILRRWLGLALIVPSKKGYTSKCYRPKTT